MYRNFNVQRNRTQCLTTKLRKFVDHKYSRRFNIFMVHKRWQQYDLSGTSLTTSKLMRKEMMWLIFYVVCPLHIGSMSVCACVFVSRNLQSIEMGFFLLLSFPFTFYLPSSMYCRERILQSHKSISIWKNAMPLLL